MRGLGREDLDAVAAQPTTKATKGMAAMGIGLSRPLEDRTGKVKRALRGCERDC
jgi:hypothetical protein